MDDNDLEFLLQGAAWQDSLLQSYRSMHITIQSILLATSVGIFVAIISLPNLALSVVAFVVLLVMWRFQGDTASKFQEVIAARGKDVNFWHELIVDAEQHLSSRLRYFTRFKIYQKHQRDDSEHLQEMFLTLKKPGPKDKELLIEKGLGHTRKAIDNELFQRISSIWKILLIASPIIWIIRLVLLLVGVSL